MTRPIQPIAREHVVDRKDHRLATAWVHGPRSQPPTARGHWVTRSDEPPSLPVESDPSDRVLVMLDSVSSPAEDVLVTLARSGARAYVLAPARWEPSDPVLRRCSTLLVRRAADLPMSAVHTGSHAQLWLGPTAGGPAPWRLRLDREQGAALLRLFLRLFWHEAIDEAWSDGERLAFRAAAARPFDVPEPPADAALRWLQGEESLEALGPQHRVHLQGMVPPTTRVQRLWLSPSGSHHAALARLVRDGTTVVGGERGLPDVATDGHSGVVVLPGARGRLRIALSPEQAAELAARLDEPATWTFYRDARLGDHASGHAMLWLEASEHARPVDPAQVIDLPDVQASALRGMDALMPPQWPEPDPLALTVRYRFTVRPPRAPAKASEDALVARWRALDDHWSSRTQALELALAAAGEHRGRIASAFSRLAGAIVGFGRTHDELQHELSRLAAHRPSQAGPEQARDMMQRIEPLEARVSRLHREQGDVEHQARVDEEREQQHAAWEAQVEAARRELPGKREELQAAEARAAALRHELAEVERAREAAELGKQARKDLKARHGKLGDELQRLERRIETLRAARVGLEQRATAPFVFAPPEQPKTPPRGGGRFVPAAPEPTPLPVPEQALPAVGVLRSLAGQRYLVIAAWGDLELGEAAALRLGARLCAAEDA